MLPQPQGAPGVFPEHRPMSFGAYAISSPAEQPNMSPLPPGDLTMYLAA